MIAANECVATHIYFMNLPFIYRVHEYPEEEKIRRMVQKDDNFEDSFISHAYDNEGTDIY